jgi:hypothetical protein
MKQALSVLITFILLSPNLQAAGSQASFLVTGRVPVIGRVNLKRLNKLTYAIQEVSNNTEGYAVTIETNARGAQYNNKPIEIVDGRATLTNVTYQDKSIDTVKKLIFSNEPAYVQITMQVL